MRTKSQRTKSHQENIPQGNIPLIVLVSLEYILRSQFSNVKNLRIFYYISILCTLSLFHFHCQMKSLHSPVFFILTKHHEQ